MAVQHLQNVRLQNELSVPASGCIATLKAAFLFLHTKCYKDMDIQHLLLSNSTPCLTMMVEIYSHPSTLSTHLFTYTVRDTVPPPLFPPPTDADVYPSRTFYTYIQYIYNSQKNQICYILCQVIAFLNMSTRISFPGWYMYKITFSFYLLVIK